MSVVVAVRVRPFNQREIDLSSQVCVEMDGGTRTTLMDLSDPKKNKDFFFDYSFWSHDDFELNEEGLAIPTSSRYADQRHVYEQVGKQILDNAWLGYHCCLFAYGQTGAGKSYSMIGYGANKGIVPIACQEIFMRVAENDNPNLEQEVSVSMQEIYNETVQDLLVPVSKRPLGGLKIRQNQSLGFYVDGITKHIVESYAQIEKIMDSGTQNRTVASTLMNASSSRAHTIITIQFRQVETIENRKNEKLSVINLVDLAGSEKVSKTEATGKNLKEAANINLSLTTLGKVIQALAEKEMGKNKGQVVPYRESCLTKILCNALGGNSKTLMICAVSPSNNNWDETLSTLRYADQAKKIKNKATVNESATDKLIRELSQENEKLKLFMQKFQELGLNLQNMDMKNIESLDPSVFNIQEVIDKKEAIEANQHLLEDITKTKEQRNQENKISMEEEDGKMKIDLNKPHLCNVHEDPQLHNRIQYSLNDAIVIGSKNSDPKPDIIVRQAKQNVARVIRVIEPACVMNDEQKQQLEGEEQQQQVEETKTPDSSEPIQRFFIEPLSESECKILVNGCPIKEKTQLYHLDRIVINSTSMFTLVVSKSMVRETAPTSLESVDFDFVQDEMQAYVELEMRSREQENAEKQIEKEQETQKLSLEQQKVWDEQKRTLEEQIKQLQTEKKKPEKVNKFKDKNYLEHKLQKFLPKVLEVNLIAKELKRNITLQAKISQLYSDGDEEGQTSASNGLNTKSKIQIQVDNRELGQIFIWDQDKFNERYYQIKELLENYFDSSTIPVLAPEDDPFYDPPQAHLIGNGYFKLLYLAYFMDSSIELSLVGENGQCGSLQVDVIPCDATGEINLAKQMEEEGQDIIEDPKQLLGQEMYVKIEITKAQLPENFCRDTYVEYTIIDFENKSHTFRTNTIIGKNSRPNYNFSKVHHFDSISQELLGYFEEKNLVFKVYGLEEIKGGESNKQVAQIPVEEEIEYAHLKNQQKKQNPGVVPQTMAQPNPTLNTQSTGDSSRQNTPSISEPERPDDIENIQVSRKNPTSTSNPSLQSNSSSSKSSSKSTKEDQNSKKAAADPKKKKDKEDCTIF